MIKRLIAVSAALLLVLSSTGCVGISFSDYSEFGQVAVTASGKMTTVDYQLTDFTKLTIDIPCELYYTAGETGSVTLEINESFIEFIDVSLNNGTVVISVNRGFSINNDKQNPKIYVTAPLLERLDIKGLVNVKEADRITSDSFALTVGGAFNGALDLAVKELNMDVSGIGNLSLTGTADKAVIDSSGAVNVEAFGLQIKEAEVEVSGIGQLEISCSDKLVADVSGVGGVSYKGNPNVTPNVSGIGGLKKVD